MPLCVRGISHGTQRRYCRLGPWIWTEREMTASSGTFRGAARSIHALFTWDPKQKNVRGRSLAVPESAEPPPAHGFRGSGQDVPARASGRGVATNLPFAWVESAVTAGESVRRLPGASLRPGGRTRGRLGFMVKTQRLLLKYDRELTGACVNRKYLHAINVRSDKRLGRTELGKRLFP